MGTWKRSGGLSLVELMVTIFVLAILASVAVPSFRSVMARGDIANAINSLSADMQFARGQAASQHRFVSICRSTTGTGCEQAESSPFDYDAGWIVYSYDVTADGADQEYSSGSKNMDILRYTSRIRGVSLRGTDGSVFTFNQTGEFVTSAGRTGLSFVACARKPGEPDDRIGTNEEGRQGALLTLRASGAITVTPLPLTSSCFP
jgi:type IV fimbrial biogenesis protein FimT